jgi:hypothetical protein
MECLAEHKSLEEPTSEKVAPEKYREISLTGYSGLKFDTIG